MLLYYPGIKVHFKLMNESGTGIHTDKTTKGLGTGLLG